MLLPCRWRSFASVSCILAAAASAEGSLESQCGCGVSDRGIDCACQPEERHAAQSSLGLVQLGLNVAGREAAGERRSAEPGLLAAVRHARSRILEYCGIYEETPCGLAGSILGVAIADLEGCGCSAEAQLERLRKILAFELWFSEGGPEQEFVRQDLDSNGAIGRVEFRRSNEMRLRGAGTDVFKDAILVFERSDADGDGELCRREVEALLVATLLVREHVPQLDPSAALGADATRARSMRELLAAARSLEGDRLPPVHGPAQAVLYAKVGAAGLGFFGVIYLASWMMFGFRENRCSFGTLW